MAGCCDALLDVGPEFLPVVVRGCFRRDRETDVVFVVHEPDEDVAPAVPVEDKLDIRSHRNVVVLPEIFRIMGSRSGG